MSESMISRRNALCLLGLGAAFCLAMPMTALMTSEAKAQETGTERRQERRTERTERRRERRSGRQERRDERQTGRVERREDRKGQ
jgi:hypothetical protein